MFVCRKCAARLLDRSSRLPSSRRSLNARNFSVPAHGSEPPNDAQQSQRHLRRDRRPWLASSEITRARYQNNQYSTSSTTHPFRLAIVGSGPAGFYTASRVLKHHHETKIDMYERLPVPFGLVRYGVAPDHPEVKNCQDRFEEIAQSPGFEFIGNVDVGGQVPLSVLKRHYDAILFTYGANKDRELGIEGENLKGVWSARSFVAWYNGLPGYSDLDFGLSDAFDAAIIGQGNVSLDVARILLTHVDDLRKTDVPEHVLEALSKSNVKHAAAVGRRGPLQAAFTIKEIRELTAIPGVGFGSIDPSFFPSDLKTLPRARKRIAELLLKASSKSASSKTPTDKSFNLEFLLSPVEFKDSPEAPGALKSIVLQRQSFGEGYDAFDSSASVKPIQNDLKSFNTSLAFRSVGYKSTPLPGLSDLGIQFDTRKGIIPNDGGRVVQIPANQPGVDVPQALPGLYVAGWVKRGPTGVIASTMEDAFATADCIVQDISTASSFLNGELSGEGDKGGWEGARKELHSQGINIRSTNWEDWRRIDQAERKHGSKLGKEREKITRVDDMLKVIDG